MRSALAASILYAACTVGASAQGIPWAQYKPLLATCVKHYLCETNACQRSWRCDDQNLTPSDREYLSFQGQALRGTGKTAAAIANERIRAEIEEIGDASVGAEIGGPRDLSLGEVDPDAPKGELGEIDPQPYQESAEGAFGGNQGDVGFLGPVGGGFLPDARPIPGAYGLGTPSNHGIGNEFPGGIGLDAPSGPDPGNPAFGQPHGLPSAVPGRLNPAPRFRQAVDPYDRPVTGVASVPTTDQKVRVSVDNGTWKEIDLHGTRHIQGPRATGGGPAKVTLGP